MRGAGRAAVDLEALGSRSGRITALEEQRDPGRRSVMVDGEFALGLDVETIVRCGFRVGQEVTGEDLVRAYLLDQRKQAWDAAVRLLGLAARTRREVERRLLRRYPPGVVADVLDRLEEGGWLDDRAYAQAYIRAHPEHGARRLLADLVRKGVAPPVAAQAVQEALGDEDVVCRAREVAERRLGRMGAVDAGTAWRRLAGYLARRGFPPEVIRQALEPLLRGEGAE